MIGLGTIVNTAAVIAGGLIGSRVKHGLPERFRDIVMQAVGLAVVIIGVSGTLHEIFNTKPGSTDPVMLMIFSLVIGSVIGEWIGIEAWLGRLGKWFEAKFAADGDGSFAQGFVSASLLFCVGAMAIVGSLKDGLEGKTEILFAKSILDGVSSIVFASTMGIGVVFSAVSVLAYQGSITLLAKFIAPYLTPEVTSQMSLVGNVLILAIGINLLRIRVIKVGNMLPAIFLPLVYYFVLKLIG
ncbi:DUF554 domain-containing protein [bacterium]|nr:DUF554 domain-containing protein [bacterium]